MEPLLHTQVVLPDNKLAFHFLSSVPEAFLECKISGTFVESKGHQFFSRNRLLSVNLVKQSWFMLIILFLLLSPYFTQSQFSPFELATLADTGRCRVLFRATEAPYADTAVSARVCRSTAEGPVLLRSSVGLNKCSSGVGLALSTSKGNRVECCD